MKQELVPKGSVGIRRRWPLGALLFACAIFLSPSLLVLRARRQVALNHSLIEAVKRQDAEAAGRLLDDGADANAQDQVVPPPSFWQTLLLTVSGKAQAPKGGLPTCLNLTLETFTIGRWGWDTETRLEPNAKIVSLLLSHGARVNAQGPLHQYPLIIACRDSHWDVAKLLVDHGANVNAHDENDQTPLLKTAFQGGHQNEMVLLQHGANPNVEDFNHWTPLMYAIVNHDTDLVRSLIRFGSDVNHVAGDGRIPNTPVTYARFLGWCPDIVHVLVKAGAHQDLN